MLNDAVCFKAVYIVCGYTDLRSGIDSLAAVLEAQTGSNPYVPDTLYSGGFTVLTEFWGVIVSPSISQRNCCCVKIGRAHV